MSGWRNAAIGRRLGIDYPIIQGPFGGGLSAVDLVVAVCESGGLGSFGVHHLDGGGIHRIAASIRERTQRPFALNLWIPFEDADDPRITDEQFASALQSMRPYFVELDVPLPARPARFTPSFDEQIRAVLEVRPAVFSFVYGIPQEAVVRACRERNILTLGAATTPEEAVALERAGVDMIVATGFEAGGHRVSFLRSAEDSLTGTMSLVPQVVDAVSVPVVAAGGIADGRGIVAALSLGAQGVQIGTAFLACEESGTTTLHREALRSPASRYTALTTGFTGRLARGIENRFIREVREQAPTLAPYPVQAWITAQFKQPASNAKRSDLLPLWSGQSAPLIRHRHARELFSSLVSQTEAMLAR